MIYVLYDTENKLDEVVDEAVYCLIVIDGCGFDLQSNIYIFYTCKGVLILF